MTDDMDELVIREKAEAFNTIIAEEWMKGYEQCNKNWIGRIDATIKEFERIQALSPVFAEALSIHIVKAFFQNLLK